MTPEQRLLLANDRMADLQRERAIDRLVATTGRPTTVRPPRTPLVGSFLRRLAGTFAA